ncbi:MAG: hypothetical protein NTZ05_22985 [Chloroflexi bacterium]|nr:hypothetical protein [Chloroflexota bacterium]
MPGKHTALLRNLAAGASCALLTLAGCQAAVPAAPAAPAATAPAASAPAPTATTAPAAAPTTAAPAAAGSSPTAGPSPTPAPPTKPDGIYTPTTYREIYQKISSDYQEIVALTNQVLDGKPMPSAEILKIYEEAKLAKVGTGTRPMRGFAREQPRTTDFPESVAFFNSPTFLDDPVIEAISGTGSAAAYTLAQRRQAIQKGLQNIIYHWSRRYVEQAAPTLNAGWVDEGWAIYMGWDVDGKYPNSISALALSREGNYNRPGSIDVPLRQALSKAQKAAQDKNKEAYQAAANEAYSRYNAIFYLGTARYLNEPVKSAQAKKLDDAGVQMVEGASFYRAIRPTVAKASAAADKTIMAFFATPPASLTVQQRDDALAALNQAFDALLLKPTDKVTPATFN